MVHVNKVTALEEYKKRIHHHAENLKTFEPILHNIVSKLERISDRIVFNQSTIHFWIDDTHYICKGYTGANSYQGIHIYEYGTDNEFMKVDAMFWRMLE